MWRAIPQYSAAIRPGRGRSTGSATRPGSSAPAGAQSPDERRKQGARRAPPRVAGSGRGDRIAARSRTAGGQARRLTPAPVPLRSLSLSHATGSDPPALRELLRGGQPMLGRRWAGVAAAGASSSTSLHSSHVMEAGPGSTQEWSALKREAQHLESRVEKALQEFGRAVSSRSRTVDEGGRWDSAHGRSSPRQSHAARCRARKVDRG